MKRIYLVLIIVISLVSLSLYSTYAMFTASVETEDFVELSASILPTETRLQEYKRLTINAGESQSILLTIVNSSENNLYYGVWYEMINGTINDDITIAKLSSSTNETSGSINNNETRYVKVVIKNTSNSNITVNVGVAYSQTSSLNLPTTRILITDTIQGKYVINNTVTNGTANPSTIIVDKGNTTTFTTTPNTGYQYKSVSCTNATASYSNGTITLSNIKDDVSCTIINEIITYTVNVNASNASVSPASRVINYNGSSTFTVTPNTGYEYSSLSCPSGITGSYSTSNNNLTVSSVKASGTCTVNFTRKTYTVTVRAVNGTASPTSRTVQHGNSTTFTVKPNSGYEYESISCTGGSYNTSNSTLTVSNVTSNRTCTINFKSSKYEAIDNSGANAPSKIEGMIPVMYYNGNWVKADTTSSTSTYGWYDYNSQKWANAVLVTSSSRSKYQGASAGTAISESDVLAYYVWIPRYKYKVWNINKVVGTDSYSARTTGIDIVFENGTSSTGTISCSYSFASPSSSAGSPNETCTGSNGQYYTHPAFTLGDTELTGIWVGKFEISSSNPTGGSNYGGGNTTDLTVRVKPNVTSWRHNTVTNFYYVIKAMSNTGNEYGLSTDSDSHMMKNTEWGAVAYLTNSKYGLCSSGTCKEIGINNAWDNSDGGNNYNTYYTTKTGCGAAAGSSYSSTCNAYNTTTGMLASTTGNIYGVYDMSGGAYEYVMGNMSSGSGSYTYNVRSGGSNYTYDTSTAKYIDTYAYGTSYNNQTAYNRARLGDATGEVVSSGGSAWYSDYARFPYSSNSWFMRGGYLASGSIAGVFLFFYYSGGWDNIRSARAVLVGLT